MKTKIFLALAVVSLGAYSCVSPKKLQEAENKYTQLNGAYAELQGKYFISLTLSVICPHTGSLYITYGAMFI
jgi:hypothetical protein